MKTGEISLYFHIPFCIRKCPYCHFFVIPYQEDSQTKLIHALKIEWTLYQALASDKKIVSIYFGGGTPFLIGPKSIQEILSWIPYDDAEITLEANPENVSLELLKQFTDIGVNRLSLGIQSLDDSLLKILGRHHTSEKAQQAVITASKAGFKNITVDLMYDIPGQTLDSWNSTLIQTLQLPIQHLSLYNLTFEPQTLFFKQKAFLSPQLPSEEESLKMLQMAIYYIKEKGLKQYEISAFAKEGYYSKHNLGYWIGRPFLGFGPSAFSFWEGRRYRNYCHLNKYCELLKQGKVPIDFEEKLSPISSLHERLAVHLRVLEGISLADYPVNESLYQKLEEKGWLKIEGQRACLTELGRLFYDSVAEEIILV